MNSLSLFKSQVTSLVPSSKGLNLANLAENNSLHRYMTLAIEPVCQQYWNYFDLSILQYTGFLFSFVKSNLFQREV